jgi:hypothetical protein
MSPLVDRAPVPARPAPGALLLTKRRPIDFGRVATCLCRLVP